MSRLIVVDDEEDMLDFVKTHFTSRGHEVHVASEGNAGLELIRKSRPDLVILDIRIRGLNGLQILKEAKQAYPQVPVVIFTGYHDPELDQKAMDAGASLIVRKPIGLIELEQVVSDVLRKHPP